jgi:hypothetical protein
MCHKLVQIYACNHAKVVSTTPCPYALDTGRRVPRTDSNIGVSRSSSTVSSVTPSIRPDSQPSQLRQQPPSPPVLEPLSAYRRTTPNQLSPPAPMQGYTYHDKPSPTSPTSIWSAPLQSVPTSPLLAMSPSSTHLRVEVLDVVPNCCPYHFPRYLPQSNHPCIDCYMLPEWEHLSRRWMKWYRLDHPRENMEDLERLSGIEALKEQQMQKARKGLLNVFVDGDESAGRKRESTRMEDIVEAV